MIVGSFLGFLLLFVAIGVLSLRASRGSTEDYLTAGKSVPPWLAGLSAVATNNSGFMFIGMIGLTYTTGLSSIWVMVGWIAGDLLASLLIMRRLSEVGGRAHIQTFGDLLAHWHPPDFRRLRLLAGLLTIVFLGAYAAAQLKAGSKALHVLFGWGEGAGALMGAAIVAIYCIAGGIRASIWTDAAQSFVMLTAMGMMVIAGIVHWSDFAALHQALQQVSPTYLDWFPGTGFGSAALFVLGWLFAGFGVAGQPHIVIRYVSLDSPASLGRMRLYYYSWFVLFYGATILAGMLARLLLQQQAAFDAELALPTLALQLLPAVAVGLLIAGLFAATISTADSLVLACCAAFTRDIFPHGPPGLIATKLVTLLVVASALGLAVSDSRSVFQLVLIAWGLLGSAFAPLLLVYALGGRPDERLALAMLLTGVGVFLMWRYHSLSSLAYEAMPAILAALAVFLAGKRAGWEIPKEQT